LPKKRRAHGGQGSTAKAERTQDEKVCEPTWRAEQRSKPILKRCKKEKTIKSQPNGRRYRRGGRVNNAGLTENKAGLQKPA
jgi:hypothetical protein